MALENFVFCERFDLENLLSEDLLKIMEVVDDPGDEEQEGVVAETTGDLEVREFIQSKKTKTLSKRHYK